MFLGKGHVPNTMLLFSHEDGFWAKILALIKEVRSDRITVYLGCLKCYRKINEQAIEYLIYIFSRIKRRTGVWPGLWPIIVLKFYSKFEKLILVQ